MRQNPHVRICGGPGSATTLVYPTPRGGQVGADGEVFGVLEEALAGRILAEPVGEAGHGVEPAPVDGERAHAVERRGLPVDGAGGGPGGAPGELILADLVRSKRGGPARRRPKKATRWAVRPRAVLWDRNCRTW